MGRGQGMDSGDSGLKRIIRTSLTSRVLVLAGALVLVVLGFDRATKMPVDALPEFEPPHVTVQTEALGLSAAEVEQLITVQMESHLLNGLPWLEEIRSESIPGLSSIDLVFEPGTDLLLARQVVAERLTQAHDLPNVSKPPMMLQPTSSTNRAMMIGLSPDGLSLIEMSVLARWQIKPALMGVPGVANVAVWGQREHQLQVRVDPLRLRHYGVSLLQVVRSTGNSLWASPLSFVEASTPGTGGFIDTPNQRLSIQHLSPITRADELAQVAVEDTGRRSLRLGQVAEVVEAHQPLIGDGLHDDSPALVVVVEKFPGASTSQVTEGVEDTLRTMAPGLRGMLIDTSLYRPADYLHTAAVNIGSTLLVGLVLLLAVLSLLYRDWRLVLVCLVAVTVSVLAAVLVISLTGATLNLMVLGGLLLAVGVDVDDSISDVDHVRARVGEAHPDGERARLALVLVATAQSRRPLLVATLVILVAAVPVALLPGLVGEFAQPLALSFAAAAVASALVALTVTPALTLLLGGGPQPASQRMYALRAGYGRVLTRLTTRTKTPVFWVMGAVSAAVVAAGLVVGGTADHTIVPQLQERAVLLRWSGPIGTSHPEMLRVTARASRELRAVPGIVEVGAQVGRAITSDRVVDVNASELWVRISPSADYSGTWSAIQRVADGYPGMSAVLTTQAEERLQAVRTGADEDLVVRVYGQDPAVLQRTAGQLRAMIGRIDGVVRPRVELEPVEPAVEIEVDLAAARQFQIKPGDVRRAAATLLAGIEVGSIFQEQKVFDVVVWGVPQIRHSVSDIEDLLIDRPDGGQLRLGDVAKVRIEPNTTVIRRESVARLVDVVAEVRGRDRADVAADVEAELADVDFPLEYRATVLDGTSSGFTERRDVLGLSVCAALIGFLILQAAFASWRIAALVAATLPLALLGAVLALVLSGGALTLVATAALLTVLGLAVRHALAVLDRLRDLDDSADARQDTSAVAEVSSSRLTPVLATTTSLAALLLPIAVRGDTAGLETLQPAAVVIIGGLVTTTLSTLFLVPAGYLRYRGGRHYREGASG